MKVLFIILLLFTQTAYSKTRECNWEKKWEIVIPEKNINCKNVSTRTFLLYWSAEKAVMENCKITSGSWVCYYSGKVYNLKTAHEISKYLHIDHMLSWHEQVNRGVLNKKNVCEIYNDIENLVVSSAKENQEKSDYSTKPIFLRTNKPQHELHYYKNKNLSQEGFWHQKRKYLLKDLKIASCDICTKYQLLYCEDFCN